MTKRPIYWAKVFYKMAKKKNIRKVWKDYESEAFVTTGDVRELSKDQEFLNRIAIKAKNNIKDVDLVIKSIQFISQHGETNDRF